VGTDLAVALGISRDTVSTWRKRGILGHVRALGVGCGGRRHRYRPEHVVALLREHGARLLRRCGAGGLAGERSRPGASRVAEWRAGAWAAELYDRIPTAREIAQRAVVVDLGGQGVGTWRTKAQPCGTWVTCDVLVVRRACSACACGEAVGACVSCHVVRVRGGQKLGGRGSVAYSPPRSTVSRRELTGQPVVPIPVLEPQGYGLPEWSLA